MKPYHFVLPESFDPREFLRLDVLRNRMDDARYFVSLILTKLAHRDVDEMGLVRLHAKHLKNIMYQTTYSDVVDELRIGGAIERFPYRVGERSFGFRLAARFITDKHVRVPASDQRLIGRLTAFHKRAELERQGRMLPVHRALAKQQIRLRIHGDDARGILAGLPRESNPYDTQGILVRDIENREFHSNVGRYGRLSNNITNLKRELRDTLHVGRRRLVNVDLSCAQPAFIARIMQNGTADARTKTLIDSNRIERNSDRPTDRKAGREEGGGSIYDSSPSVRVHYDSSRSQSHFSDSDPDGDVELYRRQVQTGQFYDYMAAKLREHGISREDFKRRFLADVVAKRKASSGGREYPSVVEAKFRELFPNVYRFIRQVNRDGWEHANLIRELQRAESELVIETVAADLVTRFPRMFLITLHDAIYTTDEHLRKVEEAFRRAFDQTGFPMSLKIVS
jgi:hypothetical protein